MSKGKSITNDVAVNSVTTATPQDATSDNAELQQLKALLAKYRGTETLAVVEQEMSAASKQEVEQLTAEIADLREQIVPLNAAIGEKTLRIKFLTGKNVSSGERAAKTVTECPTCDAKGRHTDKNKACPTYQRYMAKRDAAIAAKTAVPSFASIVAEMTH